MLCRSHPAAILHWRQWRKLSTFGRPGRHTRLGRLIHSTRRGYATSLLRCGWQSTTLRYSNRWSLTPHRRDNSHCSPSHWWSLAPHKWSWRSATSQWAGDWRCPAAGPSRRWCATSCLSSTSVWHIRRLVGLLCRVWSLTCCGMQPLNLGLSANQLLVQFLLHTHNTNSSDVAQEPCNVPHYLSVNIYKYQYAHHKKSWTYCYHVRNL